MVERVGLESIKEGYRMYKSAPYYAVFDMGAGNQYSKGRPGNLLFSYKEDDRDGDGWQLLEANLMAGEQNAPGTGYIIRFYEELDKRGSITSDTPYSGCFKANISKAEYGISRVGAAAGGSTDLINQLFQSKLDNLELRYEHKIEQLQQEHEEELEDLRAELEERPGDDKAVGQLYQWGDTIGSLGEKYPWLRENITRLFSTANDIFTLGKHTMKKQFAPQQAASMGKVDNSGQTPEARINQAVGTILSWYANQQGDINNADVRKAAAEKCADDLELLAGLTNDDDVMHLALKKLRQLG